MRRELTHGSLFSGVEGFGLGAALAGIKTEWSCEFEKYQTKVIKKNFGDGHTVYGDIRTLENPPFVNIISNGFPCQDISAAGKGAGIKGSRSGLWGQMHRIIGEVRPDYVIIENSPLLRKRGFEYVLHGLSEIGYDAQWQCLQGTFLGLQQRRERIYILLPTPRVSSANGSPRNRFFGSPTYRGNLEEYIRDGETDGAYPNPELSEALMGFPTSWTETSV